MLKVYGLTAKGGKISMQERVLKVLEFEKEGTILEHVASSFRERDGGKAGSID